MSTRANKSSRSKTCSSLKRESRVMKQNEDKKLPAKCDKHIGLDTVITVISPGDKDCVMLEEQRRSDHAHLWHHRVSITCTKQEYFSIIRIVPCAIQNLINMVCREQGSCSSEFSFLLRADYFSCLSAFDVSSPSDVFLVHTLFVPKWARITFWH